MPPADPGRVVDELCDRFENALQAGDARPLDDWLAEAGPLAPAALPELALLDLEYRAQRGEPAIASNYFARYPGLRADLAAATRLAAAEFRAERSRDPLVTATAFRQRYLDLALGPAWSHYFPPSVAPPADTVDHVGAAGSATSETSPHQRDPSAFLRELLAPADRPGEPGRLGNYRVIDVLDSGGIGVMLRVEEEPSRRPVALRLLWPEITTHPAARECVLREARTAAEVRHPHLVVIHRVEEINGTPVLVMPLLRGQSLAAWLRTGSMPRTEAVRLAREAAEGLSAAHERGLVHGDVKPENVWLEQSPDGVHVRLLDFGLARCDPKGTPSYTAPEQADGQSITAQADVFGLGAVLYEMVTGVRPFQRTTALATLTALVSHHPPTPREVRPSLPAALSELVVHMLDKAPSRRPVAAEVVASLKGVEERLATRTEGVQPPARPTARSRRWWWVAAALGLLAAGLVAALL